ncbi:MAG: HlyD family efflux transporter periplasmic adaptor subunit [Myxococcales bacterium]|nr:HlyD family secretion protein [Deltaproteobacteria bacterium]MBT8481020.1 HlyD family secretion protein [Deltaproteobacteria bacterium]NNK44571.1 HlyD family efflux transporter periplasmic adaptor subunit [Myxococcales bacterium]NNL23885.1 HlyD family efflux transporter periplasmic adaptor subunit [Myxococcales bacterium]RZV55272.1 MAG: HlyD family efflux transporter periplasmic adaptor subunit [Deltaproteobacteria bacterium]
MRESSVNSERWSGFERHTLPESLGVPAPRRTIVVAKTLVAVFLLFTVAALLAPWTQNIRGRGRVFAYAPEQRQQPIEATISGRVEKWFVQEGTQVKKGDPIVKLTDNDESILDRLGAEREAIELRRMAQSQRVGSLSNRIESIRRSQRAEISAAESNVQIAQRGVDAAVQDVGAATAEVETNELNLRRQRGLFDDGLASQREFELAELAARQSRAKLASANAKLAASKNRLAQSRAALRRVIASTEAEVENAEASWRSAETEVASTNAALARLDVGISRQQAQTITAPLDGTILRVVGRLGGEQVSQGEVLAVLVPLTEDRAVELYVDGNDAALIKPGSPVRLQFEGWPAVQFSGWPSVAVGTFGGRVAFVDASDDGRGDFRIVVVPDAADSPWPAASYLRQGVLAKGWVLLKRVSLGFEIWRQFNGFPPTTDPPPMATTGKEAK